MALRSLRRSAEVRRGVAAVEFAIILPFLVFILVGLWDLGQIMRWTQILSVAAREGGRQASTGVKTWAQVESLCRLIIKQNNNNVTMPNVTFTGYNLTLGPQNTTEPTAASQSDRLRVRLEIPLSNVQLVSNSFRTLPGPGGQVLTRTAGDYTLGASSFWQSMRDLPISIDLVLPSGQQATGS